MTDKKEEIYLNSTLAYCDTCNTVEMARIMGGGEGVYLERVCNKHGHERVKIAASLQWYMERVNSPQNIEGVARPHPPSKGCPFDCGPCGRHSGGIHLPVFSITNDCNLDCPICFTFNRPDRKYYKTVEEVRRIITHIIEQSGGVQLINLTGGEPTLHPDLFAIIDACRHEGIERITMNTNGLRIARDPEFAQKMKDAGVQLVLSLDTFDPEKSLLIHGKDITKEKTRCLETLESLNIPTTILSVCIKSVNEGDIADIVHSYLKKGFVKSITIQNMTFTGKNGSLFSPRKHITIDEVETLIAAGNGISRDDFFSLASYHPLCYSVAYFIVEGEEIVSFTDIFDKETLKKMTEGSYHLKTHADFGQAFEEGITHMWAQGADEERIRVLRGFYQSLFPRHGDIGENARQRLIEEKVKTIYIHPHMDRDNFDIDRVSRCGDMVPDEDGRMVPACAYNLLYRQQDPRFWKD